MISVAVIGLGPCGLSLLHAFDKEIERLKNSNSEDIKFRIVCFEQEKEVGGLWNFSWKTGVNEHGNKVHQSMYTHLWSNGPKEGLEMLDYSFDQHFGQNIGSFPPRRVLKDYILGRVRDILNGKRVEIEIKLAHQVLDVQEMKCNNSDVFKIKYKDLRQGTQYTDVFTHCVVATGHFSTPNIVEFKGFDEFNGRIIHSHDFRQAKTFKDQNVIVIGSSYSAEDIGLQCWKFGAKSVTISYRTAPMGFKWPKGMKEVPLLQEITNGNTAKFIDGTVIENVDAIISCTGYKHSFPFLSERMRLKTDNRLYPDNLYKGVVFVDCPNVFYLGMQDQFYTFTMFDLQAQYTKDVILGNVEIPQRKHMKGDILQWKMKEKFLPKCDADMIRFQTEYIKDLYANVRYPLDYTDDVQKLDCQQLFEEWEHDKEKDILSYRDACFTSKVTGVKAIKFHTPWVESFDDSIDCFISEKVRVEN